MVEILRLNTKFYFILISYFLFIYYCVVIESNALSWQQWYVVQQKRIYTWQPRNSICHPIIFWLIIVLYYVITDILNLYVAWYYHKLLNVHETYTLIDISLRSMWQFPNFHPLLSKMYIVFIWVLESRMRNPNSINAKL